MNWKEIKDQAREKLKGFCRVCPNCDGRACAGEVPGMGGTGTGSAFRANIDALAQYKLNLRTLHEAKSPNTSLKLFGKELNTPILAAPMTGVSYNMGGTISEREFIGMIMSGCRAAGSMGMSGDGGDPQYYDSGLEAIVEESGLGIPFIKPREVEAVKERVRRAEKAGAPAVGVDVDGAGLVTMALHGQPVGPKTIDEMKEIISSTNLPFIVKGIMTVDEALAAARAGAAAVVVSNHGGRILDHTPGAAEVLSEIATALKGRIKIFADGGVRTGIDVLKLLALGADTVLVGRPMVTGAFGAGADGVKFVLEKMTGELKQAMILTGCSTLDDIGPQVLRK